MLLAVIDPRWLAPTDDHGRRRIGDPNDWIGRELVEAFATGARVIPVLTDDASLPAEANIPADLAWLSRCQYRRLRHQEPAADLARLRTDLTALARCWPLRPGAAQLRPRRMGLHAVEPAGGVRE